MNSKVPQKGSKEWKKNESIIAKNPILRAARDQSQGLGPSSTISTGVNDEEYKAGYDKIKWIRDDNATKPRYRVKINGVYQDNDET